MCKKFNFWFYTSTSLFGILNQCAFFGIHLNFYFNFYISDCGRYFSRGVPRHHDGTTFRIWCSGVESDTWNTMDFVALLLRLGLSLRWRHIHMTTASCSPSLFCTCRPFLPLILLFQHFSFSTKLPILQIGSLYIRIY